MTMRSRLAILLLSLGAFAGCSSSNPTVQSPSPTPLSCVPATDSSVSVVDSEFKPKDLCIKSGTTVSWKFQGSLSHTVTADDGSFDSEQQKKGFTFTQTPSATGTLRYYCSVHGGKGGIGMSGTITVVSG